MLPILLAGVALVAIAFGFWYLSGGSAGKPAEAKSSTATQAAKTAPKESTAKAGTAKAAAAPPKKASKKESEKQAYAFSLKGHSGTLTSMRFSSSGQLVGTVAEDRRAIVWDVSKQPPTQLLNLQLELDHAVGCAFSPDDKFLAVAMHRSKEVKVYPTRGAKADAPRAAFKTGHARGATQLAWAYSGRYLITASDDPKDAVRVFKPSGELIGAVNAGALEVYSACVSPDSRFISVASMTCDAKIWEVAPDKDGQIRLVGKAMELAGRSGGGGALGHSAAILSVGFGGHSPAVLYEPTRMAVTASKDGTCKVWNIDVRYKQNEDPKCLFTIAAVDGKPIHHAALSPAGDWVALWSVTAGLCLFAIKGSDASLRAQVSADTTGHVFQMEWGPAAIGPHTAALATASTDGKTRIWDPLLL